MPPRYSDDPSERAAEEQCVRNIAVHGTHVMTVTGGDDWPDFAYTIGLFENYRHAELLVLGIDLDRAHLILNDARDLVRSGARFSAGAVSDQVLRNYAVTFRAIPPAQRTAHFGWADWFYGEREYPALQLIYPDRDRRWPWDERVSAAFRATQPILADVPVPEWARRRPG